MIKNINSKHIFFCILILCLFMIFSKKTSSSYTPYYPNYPPLSPEEIMEYAKEAAEYIKNGGDIEEFNKNPGKFTKGDFMDFRYISVIDLKTKTVLAHPFLPKLVNVPGIIYKMRDAKGRATVLELCEAALKKPKGAWAVSFVQKPGEENIDLVYKYILRVKNTNIAVGVNARILRIESHLEKRAREEERILNLLVK